MPPQDALLQAPMPDLAVMRRFLPYLWPKDQPGLRIRISIALSLVLVSKAVQLSMGFVYAAAINRMKPGLEAGASLAIALVAAYAGARFAGGGKLSRHAIRPQLGG